MASPRKIIRPSTIVGGLIILMFNCFLKNTSTATDFINEYIKAALIQSLHRCKDHDLMHFYVILNTILL